MRSWRDLSLAAATAALIAAAACGSDADDGDDGMPDPDACETSYLSYESFGAPFMLDWCAGCHSAAVPAGMRQNAPADVNLDTLEGVRRFADRIMVRSAGATPTMPPAGGPSDAERALLEEWIACGAK